MEVNLTPNKQKINQEKRRKSAKEKEKKGKR